MATRWGIVSAGKICHDFVGALATLPPGDHDVVAVAARDLSRAKDFAKLHKIKKAYGSYEELARDKDIEVVYIGTIAVHHLEVAKLMLNNGKHVLCEKPLTLSLKQANELINLAKEKGLFFMEAIWSRSFPVYDWIKEEIDSGNLGDIKQVIVPFGLQISKPDAISKGTLGESSILELGVYVLQFASFVYNGEKPIAVSALGHLDAEEIDVSSSATLLYKGGRTATVMTDFRVNLPNEAHIIGTKGALRVPNFWCPTQVFLPSGEVRTLSLPEAPVKFNYINSAALRFEGAEVRRCLQAGLKESPRVTHKDSLLIAELQEEIRKQLGVSLPRD